MHDQKTLYHSYEEHPIQTTHCLWDALVGLNFPNIWQPEQKYSIIYCMNFQYYIIIENPALKPAKSPEYLMVYGKGLKNVQRPSIPIGKTLRNQDILPL
jgi:hypothetical protein